MSADHATEKGFQKFLTDMPKIILILVAIGVVTNFLPDSMLSKAIELIDNKKTETNNNLALDKTLERKGDSDILSGTYKVTRVVDGDTINVIKIGEDGKESKNLESIKVRLLGINTPESVDPRREVECFGVEASNNMKLLADGKNVILEIDRSQDTYDKYGRLLAYAYLDNGEMLNEIQIKNGYAYEYTFSKPYKYQESFKKLQAFAKENNIGLWNKGACAEPLVQTPSAFGTFPKGRTGHIWVSASYGEAPRSGEGVWVLI